jgi:hypothetical protein
MPEAEAPDPEPQPRSPADAALELKAARTDQIEADVSVALARRPFGDLPCALDGFERDAQLRLSGRLGHLLHGVAIAIPAPKVHAAVDPHRVAPQNLFDQAHALEELGPVERRDEVQAAEQARHEGLCRCLVAPFGPYRILERQIGGRETVVEFTAQHARVGLVLA